VSIDHLVQRIHENNAIQVVANNLLANSTTSAVFATILVEFLLKKMPEMGEDAEKSNLYLRLFKLVFGSVSLFPVENEQMLRPHLRDIVNKSMELALNAKDPFNYFLLLRALFRSIGGGSHDLLYQEFLPLLPSLLQGTSNEKLKSCWLMLGFSNQTDFHVHDIL
jgi:transformation/transcription domain-associated protein